MSPAARPLSEQVAKYLVIPDDAVVAYRLKGVLAGIFYDCSTIEKYASPEAFTGLMDWACGDALWPAAALVMQRGLGYDHAQNPRRTHAEIAKICGVGVRAVGVALGRTGRQSFVWMLHRADQRLATAPRHALLKNELRALGLDAATWGVLAEARIFTVDALCQFSEGELAVLKGLRRVGAVVNSLPEGKSLRGT